MTSFSTELQGIIRLLLALVCGAAVGLDRERGHRPAGLRTHTLVCMGACLVMYTSFWAIEKYHLVGDPMRMSAQVISGIGFLGAGTIIKAGKDVRGLTTAACLWIVACIGLAIGAGYYIGGLLTTALVLLTLSMFKFWESRYEQKALELFLRADNEPDVVHSLVSDIQAQNVQIHSLVAKQESDQVLITMTIYLPSGIRRTDLVTKLLNDPRVNSVSDQPLS